MYKLICSFLEDENGATAIEYGLIAAGIAGVVIASVNALGEEIYVKFDYITIHLAK